MLRFLVQTVETPIACARHPFTLPMRDNQWCMVQRKSKALRKGPLRDTARPTTSCLGFLATYKTLPCRRTCLHDWRLCGNFHEKDARRNPFLVPYLPHDALNMCEYMYHPMIYKTKLCSLPKSCPRADFCALAHSTLELRSRKIAALHYHLRFFHHVARHVEHLPEVMVRRYVAPLAPWANQM